MGGGIHGHVTGVLEGQGGFDLLGLLRGGGEEDEVDILAARGLSGDLRAEGALQALGTRFALAQLEQVGDLLGQFHRLIDVLGGDQAAAGLFPVLAECIEYTIAPFATRHQCHGATHAVAPGAAGHFTGFVLGGKTELEQLGGPSWPASL